MKWLVTQRARIRLIIHHVVKTSEAFIGLALAWPTLRNWVGTSISLRAISYIEALRLRALDDLIMRPFLRTFYRKQFANWQPLPRSTANAVDRRRQVVFLLNIVLLFRQPVSSHLKLIGDIAALYMNNGFQVTILFANHPYTSRPSNANLAVVDMYRTEKAEIEQRIRADLHSMIGRDFQDCAIRILQNVRDDFNLKTAVNSASGAITELGLGPEDTVFGAIGVIGSDLFNAALGQVKGPRKHCLGFSADMMLDTRLLRNFDNVIQPLGTRKIFKDPGKGDAGKILDAVYSVSPLAWGLAEENPLSHDEEQLLQRVSEYRPHVILHVVKQAVVDVLTEEFAQALRNGCPNGTRVAVVLVGTNGKAPKPLTRNGIWRESEVFSIDYSDNLYRLFLGMLTVAPSIMCMPRCSGGGFGIQLSGFAGMPLVSFVGSDAEIYYPSRCFSHSVEGYSGRLHKLISNAKFREAEVVMQRENFDSINASWKKFYLKLVA